MLCVRIFYIRQIYERPHRYCLENGKLYDFLFGFLAVDFVLALHAAAEKL